MDVRATEINEAMKLAAVHALAHLSKEPVPEMVNKAYGDNTLAFGRTYLIPKPLDPRLITSISPAVARAAMESGVARLPIEDWTAYEDQLRARLGVNPEADEPHDLGRPAPTPSAWYLPKPDNYKTLKAAQILHDEGICTPILLGPEEKIEAIARENSLDLEGCEIINILKQDAKRNEYAALLYQKRQRRGMTLYEGRRLMRERNYYAAMMVETGEADACITGLTKDYGQSPSCPRSR